MVDLSKATPRPWSFYMDEDGVDLSVRKRLDTGVSKTICSKPDGIRFEVWQHDAALIVQAVNSFDALREALSFYVGICGNTCHSVSRETAQEMYDKAISAIAIAEGRAQ